MKLYERYRQIRGDELPKWDALSAVEQGRWRDTLQAARDVLGAPADSKQSIIRGLRATNVRNS